LHNAAADLAFDQHRVDHRPAILGDSEVEKLDKPGLGIDRDDSTMRRIGENAGADRRLVRRSGVEQWIDPLR